MPSKTTIYPCSQMKTKLEYLGYQVEHIRDTFYEIKMYLSKKTMIVNFITKEFRVIIGNEYGEIKFTKDIINTIEFNFSQKDGIQNI